MEAVKSKKEVRDVRLTFRMTKREAEKLEQAAKALECKPSYLARLAIGAVTQATEEGLQTA